MTRDWREELGNPMFAAAVVCARHDLPVYPARPKGKAPLFRGWQRAATTKVEQLAKHWRHHPDANVGIICRHLLILDADSRRGMDAVADLGLPATTTVTTLRGSHRYFLGRARTRPGILPDVEARGFGSGVLAPGSVHPSGFEYEREIPPWEVPPAGIPPVLAELLDRDRGTTPRHVHNGRIPVGSRHVVLLRIAGSLRGRYGVGELLPVLHAINESTCEVPLPASDLVDLAKTAERWDGLPPWLEDPQTFCFGDERLSRDARLILQLLVHHADLTGCCFPSTRRLAERAKLRKQSVFDAIRELENAGRIEVKPENRVRSNRYRLLGNGVGGTTPVLTVPTSDHPQMGGTAPRKEEE